MAGQSSIYRVLNLEKGEGNLVFLPIVFSFFNGVALAFFVTSATSIFLSSFERDMLSISFIVAGIFVLSIGQLYNFVQRKYKFSVALTAGQSFLVLSILSLLIFFRLFNALAIIFVLYAWIRVFAYIQAVTFWGMAGRLFSLQQAKRLFALITFGEVIASILSFFSIPFILKFTTTENLLFVSGVAVIISFFVLLIIIKKHKSKLSDIKKSRNTKSENKKKSEKSKIIFFKNRYYKLFFLIAFIPIFSQFLVDFIFQAQAKIEFPEKESLTAFVGLFFGVSSIVEFLLKVFLSGKLMTRYGVRFGLLAFPTVLAISFVLATTAGIVYGAVSLFFSFVTLGRLFARAVRTSFNDPATQILYQPLPPDERALFQNKIESGPKAFASIFAGILLFAFAKISWFSLVYFSIFLLIVIAIWLRTASEIYIEYKKVLQNALKNFKGVTKQGKVNILLDIFKNKINSSSERKQHTLIKLYRNIFPYKSTKDVNKELGVNITVETKEKYKFETLVQYSNSEDPKLRAISAKLFSEFKIYKVEKNLIKLLNDKDFEVRKEAIISAGKMKDPEFFQNLFANFKIPEYTSVAFSALLNIGEKILPELHTFFFKLEYYQNLQLKIIDIFEQTGGEKSIKFLRQKLNYPNKTVRDRVITALGVLNYKTSKSEKPYIVNQLYSEISNYAYAVACLIDFKNQKVDQAVIKAIEDEKISKKDKIFIHLSILYDSSAIKLISDSLESSNPETNGFALEVADTVISEDLKPVILPILEDASNEELLKKYKYIFPQEKLSVVGRLIDIINSDFAKTGVYSKATAIKAIKIFDNESITNTLKANMIHPYRLIRQEVLLALYEKDKELLVEELKRYGTKYKKVKKFSQNVDVLGKKGYLLILEKIELLKSLEIFNDIPEPYLIDIATNSIEEVIKEGDILSIDDDNQDFYSLISGYLENKDIKLSKTGGNIVSLYDMYKNTKQINFECNEHTFVLKSKLYLLNNLFAENINFTKQYVESI